jgi:type VI secretion system protein ImpA
MPSPPVLDFERLLAPISEALPSGKELREDDELRPLFDDVKDAYKDAQTNEKEKAKQETIRKAGSGSSADPAQRTVISDPDWLGVCEKSIEIISIHSKDLCVAAWLTDALVRRDGIAGLRDGFRLVRELVERYWDTIHPAPQEGSYDDTTAILRSLIGAPLVSAIRSVPLAKGNDCSFGDYRNAAKSNSQALGPILEAVEETDAAFYVDLSADLQAASDELNRMCRLFMERCEEFAPNPSLVRSEIEECLNNLRTVAPDKLAAAAADEAMGEAPPDAAGGSGGGKTFSASGQIASREEAFAALRKIAEYFKRTEPTSPVPIILEHAVRLGGKPFTELIQDLVASKDARLDVYRRIGAVVAGEEEAE